MKSFHQILHTDMHGVQERVVMLLSTKSMKWLCIWNKRTIPSRQLPQCGRGLARGQFGVSVVVSSRANSCLIKSLNKTLDVFQADAQEGWSFRALLSAFFNRTLWIYEYLVTLVRKFPFLKVVKVDVLLFRTLIGYDCLGRDLSWCLLLIQFTLMINAETKIPR